MAAHGKKKKSVVLGRNVTVKQAVRKKGGKFEAGVIQQVHRPEGQRFYLGKATSKDMQRALDKARMQARTKAVLTPADSLSSAKVLPMLKKSRKKRK